MTGRKISPACSLKPPSPSSWLIVAAAIILVVTGCQSPAPGPGPSSAGTGTATASPGGSPTAAGPASGVPGHVFVINLENKGYDKVWGADSEATYLSRTLRTQGVLLSEYYGIAHNSHPNYLAQISGQASNASTRDDCPTYTPFEQTGTAAPGQVQGDGCVYPGSVPTVAGQLTAAGKSWKGYMEDMQTPCQHPRPGAEDDHQSEATNTPRATIPSCTSRRSHPPRNARATWWPSRGLPMT